MNIFTVIVSYNFEKWIERCLGSLRESTVPTQVVVVDNCSTDNTIAIIKDNYPEVWLIENVKNVGFGKGNNVGIEYSLKRGADYVFLLNQDAWVEKETIKALFNAFLRNPQYGILSPMHVNGTGEEFDFGFSVYAGISRGVKPKLLRNRKEEVIPAPFINAAFWMIPSKVLNKVGFFSPLFYHYGEDKDYVNRLAFHGYKIGYLNSVLGYHDREYRESSRETRLHADRVYLQSEYANVNYSFWRAFSFGVLAGGKKALLALAKGEWSNFIAYSGMAIQLLLSTRSIMAMRNIAKKPNRDAFLYNNSNH